jgi:hypothetical protein
MNRKQRRLSLPQNLSPARLAANRANAQLSTGPSEASFPVTSQNRTIHGLARHQNGAFKLLTSEDPAAFAALKQTLFDEHSPTDSTEAFLLSDMAEYRWLAQRAQRLQDTCMDPDTGAILDEKKSNLYLRYQTSHARSFHKCLHDLLKLRAEKRKAELGFEAQKRKDEELSLRMERHEMKKQKHSEDALMEEARVSVFRDMYGGMEPPDFGEELAAEFDKLRPKRGEFAAK